MRSIPRILEELDNTLWSWGERIWGPTRRPLVWQNGKDVTGGPKINRKFDFLDVDLYDLST